MGGERILAVDDFYPQRLVIEKSLSATGYKVLGAPSAAEALRVAPAFQPHLAVLDVYLEPGQNGGRLYKRLKDLPTLRELRVIYITGHSEAADLQENSGEAPYPVMRKPIEPKELVAAVRKVLDGAKAAKVPENEVLVLNPNSREVRLGSRSLTLAPRRFELLMELAKRPQVTRHEIDQSVWHSSDNPRTVDVCIHRLRANLASLDPHLILSPVFGLFKLARPVRILPSNPEVASPPL